MHGGGFTIPPELRAKLTQGGKPVVLDHAKTNASSKVLLLKVPHTDVSPSANHLKLTSYAETSTIAQDAAAPAQPEINTLTITDSKALQWIGKKDAPTHQKTTTFIMREYPTHYLLTPIDGSYTFVPDTEAKIGPQEIEQIEKKRKQLLAKENKIQVRPKSLKTDHGDSDNDDSSHELPATSKKQKQSLRGEAEEEGFISIRQQTEMKLKKVLKKKRKEKDLDYTDQAQSSLAFGQIRKAEVDWDFDDKGIASDDEEGAQVSDADLPDQDNEEDVSDSEEENEEMVLTNYGENLTRLLEHQKEREADAELEQFSEDEAEQPAESSAAQPSAAAQPKMPPGQFVGNRPPPAAAPPILDPTSQA